MREIKSIKRRDFIGAISVIGILAGFANPRYRPRMVRFEGIITGHGFGEEYLSARWPNARFCDYGGKKVFHVMDREGNHTGTSVAYSVDVDWRSADGGCGFADTQLADVVVRPGDLSAVTVTA